MEIDLSTYATQEGLLDSNLCTLCPGKRGNLFLIRAVRHVLIDLTGEFF